MNLDDDICCCFHVPLRKLLNFARRERPTRPSQMSQCLGAGTGCGWCIPILKRICEVAASADAAASTDAGAAPDADPSSRLLSGLPASAAEYSGLRREYLRDQRPRHTF